jgi:predicted TIM-barrel fold metal-dependent hydrolase
MRIDVWTHVLSRAYVEQLEVQGQRGPGAFLLAQRALHDIEFRLRVIDEYGDYRQVLTPVPGMHVFGSQAASGPTVGEVVRRNNEQMAEMVTGHADRFAGFVAATPITDPDAATEEAIRSVRDLGALGVQLEEDAVNLPLHEDRYDPLFAAMEELGAGVWLHPFRTPATPGSPPERRAGCGRYWRGRWSRASRCSPTRRMRPVARSSSIVRVSAAWIHGPFRRQPKIRAVRC